MTDEIIKLYENAGVKSFKTCEFCTQKSIDCLKENISNITCGFASDIYPPFTAEKLINLEMFLINKGDFDIKKGSKDITFESFTSCISGLINNIWQDLSEEEHKQIREILE